MTKIERLMEENKLLREKLEIKSALQESLKKKTDVITAYIVKVGFLEPIIEKIFVVKKGINFYAVPKRTSESYCRIDLLRTENFFLEKEKAFDRLEKVLKRDIIYYENQASDKKKLLEQFLANKDESIK